MNFIPYESLTPRQKEGYRALYTEAFPPWERKPFEEFLVLSRSGRFDISAITANGALIGLAMLHRSPYGVCLGYFAISSAVRGQGLGGKAIELILDRWREQNIIIEIELQDPKAENARERVRRKEFYLRHGLKETGLFVNCFQTNFELLTPSGSLTFSEYDACLRHSLSEKLYQEIAPREIPAPY